MNGIDLRKIFEYTKAKEVEIEISIDGTLPFDPCIRIRMTHFVNSWPFTNQNRVCGIITNPSANQTEVIMRYLDEMYQNLEDTEKQIAQRIMNRDMEEIE